VTVPLKSLILPYLDRLDRSALGMNSVNTVYKNQGRLYGASTDGEGFLRSLGGWRKKLKGSSGMIIGAGGAARAVGNALGGSGVKNLMISSRNARKAGDLLRDLRKGFPRLQTGILSLKEGEKFLPNCDWIVQATSLGLKKGDSSPLSLQRARRGTLAVDLIYHRETKFLKEARGLNLSAQNGLGMLLHQGALSFELWTGQRAPLIQMQGALLQHLATSNQVTGRHR
jgi:shikimate dehydrogenase